MDQSEKKLENQKKMQIIPAWKICLIIVVAIITLSAILWIGLELSGHQNKIVQLEKKLEALETQTSGGVIGADSLIGLEELANLSNINEARSKLEDLERMLNISEKQKTNLEDRVTELTLHLLLGVNQSDEITDSREAELIDRISKLEDKNQKLEAKGLKELKEIKEKNENAYQELQRQLIEISTISDPRTSQSKEYTNNQQMIDLLLKLTEENKSKIETLETDLSNSDLETEWTSMKEQIEILEEKVTNITEAFNEINLRLLISSYENLKADDCEEFLENLPFGYTFTEGVKTIYINNKPVETYCPKYGWTVIQSRGQYGYPEDFFTSKLWNDYVVGFGTPGEEFWIGLENIYKMTNREHSYTLGITLQDYKDDSITYTALYENFKLVDNVGYTLQVGQYSGNATDSLTHHSGGEFNTEDRDNFKENCPKREEGPWWFNNCLVESSLNGYNSEEKTRGRSGIYWQGLDAIKSVVMAIKRS